MLKFRVPWVTSRDRMEWMHHDLAVLQVVYYDKVIMKFLSKATPEEVEKFDNARKDVDFEFRGYEEKIQKS